MGVGRVADEREGADDVGIRFRDLTDGGFRAAIGGLVTFLCAAIVIGGLAVLLTSPETSGAGANRSEGSARVYTDSITRSRPASASSERSPGRGGPAVMPVTVIYAPPDLAALERNRIKVSWVPYSWVPVTTAPPATWPSTTVAPPVVWPTTTAPPPTTAPAPNTTPTTKPAPPKKKKKKITVPKTTLPPKAP